MSLLYTSPFEPLFCLGKEKVGLQYKGVDVWGALLRIRDSDDALVMNSTESVTQKILAIQAYGNNVLC